MKMENVVWRNVMLPWTHSLFESMLSDDQVLAEACIYDSRFWDNYSLN